MSYKDNFVIPLVAGGAAGLSVDLALFPLDTLKTRLQTAEGFRASGGFRGIYSGIGSVATGSVPTAALFFTAYELVKALAPAKNSTAVHMAAASAGEVMACLVRVPTEVVKQRAQASPSLSTLSIFKSTLRKEGFTGFFRGFTSTVIREVPFSMLQFSMWEHFKLTLSRRQGHKVQPWQSACCGAVAGALAAGITTPLDVAKTRIMLAKHGSELAKGSIATALLVVYGERGIFGVFAGIVPRCLWISVGGAIFLGVYDKMRNVIDDVWHNTLET